VLSSAAIIALPGEAGTASEVALAVRYGKPVIAFSPDPKLVERFPKAVRRVERIEAVREFVRSYLKVRTTLF
jgi:predicted Rossmann-fold nucleotide-binding protein